MKKLTILLVFVILLQNIYAQDNAISFKNYSISDGLSQSSVLNFFKDSKGFLWLCTQDGLNRYDGFDFKIYKNSPNNEQTLSGNYIQQIMLEDNDGNLWLEIQGGFLNKFNPKTEKVTRYFINERMGQNMMEVMFTMMFQDSNNNIWLLSENGVHKYNPDKDNFTQYFSETEENTSISNNIISEFFEDNENNLWFLTRNGIIKYIPETDNFKKYLYSKEKEVEITCHIVDNSGKFWIGTNNSGLYKYNSEKDIFESVLLNNNKNFTDYITVLYEDNNKNIWLGTSKGLIKYNYQSTVCKNFNFEKNNVNSLTNDTITAIIQDYNGNMWIGTYKGLNKISIIDEKCYQIQNSKNVWIQSIIEDKTHKIWLRDFNEIIYLYNGSENKIEIVENFISVTLTCFYKDDKQGTLFFGTFGGGFYKYQPLCGKFEKHTEFVNYSDKTDTILLSSISGILEDNRNNLWISSLDKGIIRYNLTTKTYNQIVNTENRAVGQAIQVGNVLCIASYGTGLYSYNMDSGKLKSYFNDVNDTTSLKNNWIGNIIYDGNNLLWLATQSGLCNFDLTTEKFRQFNSVKNDGNSITSAQTWSLKIIDKELWILNVEDIVVMNLENETLRTYPNFSKDSTGILGSMSFCVIADKKDSNLLWFATDLGLAVLNRKTDKFDYYTIEDGIANDFVYAIIQAENGDLWLSTNKGISRFDYITHEFENFDKSDGLQDDEFNSGAYFQAKDGKMYFGGLQGFNAFYPEKILKDTIPPQTVITKFKIFNKEIGILPFSKSDLLEKINGSEIIRDGKDYYLSQVITYANEITISYLEKVISFEYAGIHFNSPEKITYKYILENFEEEWNYVDNIKFATYTNLPAGEYIFKVTSANSDGVWNENYTQIKLIVTPPFWERWWFRITVLLVIITIIILYIKIREKNLIEQKRTLEQKVNERTAEIQQQNEEITAQRDEIELQRNDIEEKAEILKQTNHLLIEKNEEINQQNEEIQAQRDQLEIQNEQVTLQRDKIIYQKKQITDSINYARNIQQAILPKYDLLKSNFADYFIFFKPRDIVSGDFYWLKNVNGVIVFAVADCTGHGVPGAFLSMLGITLLNELSQRKEISAASNLLEELRILIKSSLQQTGDSNEAKDGMDIALCAIDKKTLTLQYAGANNPAYLIRKNIDNDTFELIHLKPDSQPIGVYIKERKFTNHQIQLQTGDRLYLLSDGFADQFGGINGRKYYSNNLKELILSIQSENMENQKKILENTFLTWKGKLEQVDDVLVMGVEI